TVGIIFRVCREDKKDIKWQTQFESTDLHITFFKNIKQSHLYACLQIGQLIYYKNAPVAAWNNSVVNHLFICKTQFEVCCFDRVYITDQVGHTYIRCCQFFSIALGTMKPFDRRFISKLCYTIFTKLGYRM